MSTAALRVRPLSALLLAIASAGVLVMFLWPLFVSPPATESAHASDAPFAFAAILPVLIAVVLTSLNEHGIDVKALAILGILAGVGAVLRPLGAGVGGIETVFFLLILGGRVYGAGFGFVLGATTLFSSAILTAGIGPWLPFQMMAAAWIGLGAGLLPSARGRVELAMLVVYGIVAAYGFGFLMNMWFWPYAAGTFIGDGVDPGVQFVPGDPVWDNLRRYFWFTIASSTAGWDTARAVTNAVTIVAFGPAVLRVLRRTHRKAAFGANVEFA